MNTHLSTAETMVDRKARWASAKVWMQPLLASMDKTSKTLPSPLTPDQRSSLKLIQGETIFPECLATAEEIVSILDRFLVSYTHVPLSNEDSRNRMMNFLDVLSDYPAAIIQRATNDWNRARAVTGKENFAFAPSPALYVQFCDRAKRELSGLHGECRLLLEAKIEEAAKPLSEAEKKQREEKVQQVKRKIADASGAMQEGTAAEYSIKDAQRDKRFYDAFSDYPRFATSPKGPMFSAWAKLAEFQRVQITKARVMAYLDLCRRDGQKAPPAIGTVLSENDLLFNAKIEALLANDDVPSDDGSQPLNKFGKAWGVVRLSWLRAGAKRIGDVPDYRRHRDMFPRVHAMNGSAITRLSPQNAVKAETLDACQRVEQGSAEWQAWVDYHAAMDWPMVEVGDWDKPVWFPARVPSEWRFYQEVAA